ncbi:armadillo-type protein [Talaromyces proteolyticus]|uniref:Armadillo-type protein n=1 Tax=Talaromyces proteolyticus TaxID=1131652 RepID=A0AAD4KU20_9EURO|nr:armadillo-type protein [Talaromyces proteolyticus]KAH8696074.1 armadillo-type protein [Talaromyces proteolyticus]
METQRQETFSKLRPACVALSSTALEFRTHHGNPAEVQRTLNDLYSVLEPLGAKEALDAKLAEYVFFPLSQVFNETQTLPQRCLEAAVKCVTVLVAKGWRHSLAPQMGKQLLILLTMLVGGTPAQNREQAGSKAESEELSSACFDCMNAVFRVLDGPVAEQLIFNEIGTATILDQTIYLLLEGITDGPSNTVQIAAMSALHSLCARVTDRVVLASVMPRVVSTLTKILKPTTKSRRGFRLLEASLRLLTELLRTVLNDKAVYTRQPKPEKSQSSDRIVLDESWLKATTGQIKLALANVIQIRRHERDEVQKALLELCLTVIEQCSKSLKDSSPLLIETVVILSDVDANHVQNDAYSALLRICTEKAEVVAILKDLLQTWTMSFQRTMQGNDETAKNRAIKQISTAFQVLSHVQASSRILENNLASGLCDSVETMVQSAKSVPQPVNFTVGGNMELAVVERQSALQSFPPVLLDHRSQQQTLTNLTSMIAKINGTQSSETITRLTMNRIHQASGDTIIAPFWLALQFLKPEKRESFEDFLSFDNSTSLLSRVTMVEELYSIALSVLNEPPTTDLRDWRVSALALEAVALQAQELGVEFRSELIEALYPVLQFLASSNSNLQNHAMTCLNIITKSCSYSDTRTMLIENVDYLINSVGLKLNTFDISPYPPQVLLMMVKLTGAGLIPYLDDLVDSIFGIVDMYHGYPKLVELLYSTLAAIVEEGIKEPSLLAITQAGEEHTVNHRKKGYEPISVSQLVQALAHRKERRKRIHDMDIQTDQEHSSHPSRPWTRELDGPPLPEEDESAIEEYINPEDESHEPLPPPKEPDDAEKPLSKPHTLLLHIIKSIPPHLSSPSPFLRRSLLVLLTQALPVLSKNETSFLPLINEIWPSVSARIASTSSTVLDLTTPPTSTDIISRTDLKRQDEEDIKEETFVTSAACSAVASFCEHAGDFMASRVEAEYPRWRRLYLSVWSKVRGDAEKTHQRRRQAPKKSPPTTTTTTTQLILANPDLTLSTSTSRSFTPHHTLWRALLGLFINVLAHVRLPLSVGDEICEFIGLWIVMYAGPGYYAYYYSSQKTSLPKEDAQVVEDAMRAMEAWNRDLTWYIFQRECAMQKGDVRRLPEELEKFNSIRGLGEACKFVSLGFA